VDGNFAATSTISGVWSSVVLAPAAIFVSALFGVLFVLALCHEGIENEKMPGKCIQLHRAGDQRFRESLACLNPAGESSKKCLKLPSRHLHYGRQPKSVRALHS
jgi:hypothetical protein